MYTLVGVDGNAYSIMGYTARAMKHEGFSEKEVNEMFEEAKSGDYFNLLAVCSSYVQMAEDRRKDRKRK